jgi:hypothetical protein
MDEFWTANPHGQWRVCRADGARGFWRIARRSGEHVLFMPNAAHPVPADNDDDDTGAGSASDAFPESFKAGCPNSGTLTLLLRRFTTQ